MTRVAVIDDHAVVRAGLKYLIEAQPEMSFVGEHGGGVGAADFVVAAKPDVTLLDVRMPDLGGIEVLKAILRQDPEARVVMLTTSDTEEDIFRSIEEGALGYVMKESPVETIAAAIASAMAGEVFMTDDVRRIYEARRSVKGMSPREVEVLGLVREGLGNKDIAARLRISDNSVKMHLKRIFFKLGASDRAEAVALALRRGFLI